MDAASEGNSFHFGVNFAEALEDEAASSEELFIFIKIYFLLTFLLLYTMK